MDPVPDLAPDYNDLYSRRLALARDWMAQHGLDVQPYRNLVRLNFLKKIVVVDFFWGRRKFSEFGVGGSLYQI